MLEEHVEVEASLVVPVKAANSYTTCSFQESVKIRTEDKMLAELNIQTIPQFFHECCQKFKDLPALAYENRQAAAADSRWSYVSYAEYEKHVEQAALVLLHLGVKPHTSVGILAFNCPEWFYVEMAALRIGAVVAGIYTSNLPEAVYHVLAASDSVVCLVDDAQQMSKVRAVKTRLRQLRAVVQLNGPFEEFVGQERGFYRWSDLFGMQFDCTLRDRLITYERDVAANQCALLIFTSGTVGLPKGVMISHDGVLFGCSVYRKMLTLLRGAREIAVSYLPLNHIAGQLFDIFVTLQVGGLIYFADRNALKGSLLHTLASSKANILFGVPRVYEKIQESFEQLEAKSSGWTKLLMNTARDLMANYHLDKMAKKTSSALKYWFASKMVHRIKENLGLQHIRGCLVGGAPATEELKRFFLGLDLQLVDAYGMSEASGGMVYNFDMANLKTVGKALEGIEIKIDKPNENGEGEILVRGRCNLMGYLNDEEKTGEILTEDGFIRSGDLGYLDEEGNLYICGRIKELIITAGGENIPPVEIEALIKKQLPCLSNAMVVGDRKKYLTVLLTFKTDIDPVTGFPLDTLRSDAVKWLESFGCHYTHVSQLLNVKLPDNLENLDVNTLNLNCDIKVWRALEEGIKRYNDLAISNAQKVQYFTVLPHDFSLATSELGPTLKMKRSFILKKYANVIEKMYTA